MESYRGITKSDQISGGGSFVTEEGMGHEVCNFHSHRGNVYGYVQPAGANRSESAGSIKLESVVGGNVSKKDELIKGVLVIWTARRPEGGTVVVGWYKDATIYRHYKKFTSTPALHKKNGLGGYRILARTENTKLLQIDERTFLIPRRTKGSFGQSNVWFGNTEIGKNIALEVDALSEGVRKFRKPQISRSTDPEHNAKVEKAAVNLVWKYYEDLGYSLKSVEKDNFGWDLEASQYKTKLHIEVKGLSGKIPYIELSPNEYKAWSATHEHYRLAVVSNALTLPILYICRYSHEHKSWQVSSHNDAYIEIEEKVAAQVRLKV